MFFTAYTVVFYTKNNAVKPAQVLKGSTAL